MTNSTRSKRRAEQKRLKAEQKQTRLSASRNLSSSNPFFDNIIKFLTALAFAFWMIQEWILPENKAFLFLAILAALTDVFYILGHKICSKRFFILTSWFGYVVCAFFIYMNAYRGDSSKESQLEVALMTSHATNSVLELTNASLREITQQGKNIPNYDYIEHIESEAPGLLIPLFTNETSVTLQFFIRNTSKTETVEVAEVGIMMPNDASLVDSHWARAVAKPIFRDTTFGKPLDFLQLSWTSSRTLLPGDSDSLPEITFSRQNQRDFEVGHPFIIKVRAKNIPPFILCFELNMLPVDLDKSNQMSPMLLFHFIKSSKQHR